MKSCLLVLPIVFFALTAQAAGFSQLDRNTARQLTDPASHRQPTVVALWSIDCTHCKKNLQTLSSVIKRQKNLRVISVATEPATADHESIMARFDLPGPRYAYAPENPEAIAYALDPSWAGELPRTFLFDGKGGKQQMSGVMSVKAVEAAIGLR